jgi:heat shock protein HslJ
MTFTSNSVSANAGWNQMFGDAAIEDTRLIVGKLASGRMACDPALSEQDEWLSSFLTSEPTIARKDDDLWLERDATTVHLTAQ